MYPIYKFELTAGATTQRAYPIYKDDLAKNYEKESGQEFFRAKLSGQLTFESDDYTFIASKAFDTEFIVEIFISYNAGQSWQSYWRGSFWKTDCEFDEDAQTVAVKPNPLDEYADILAGLDKEYNLIELAPAMAEIQADKRPMIQVYVPGQSVIGCFLAGMWWEQECEPESNESKLAETGDGKLNFAINKSLLIADVSGTTSPQLPEYFTGVFTDAKFNPMQNGNQEFVKGDYKLNYYFYAGGGGYTVIISIIRIADSVTLWKYQDTGGGMPDVSLPRTYTLTPESGTGATGNVELYMHEIPVYSRYVCDTLMIDSLPTFELPTDDIVENNRNYTRVIGYDFPNTIAFSENITTTPTQWGLYQPGQYYQQPYSLTGQDFFPVARNGWGRMSVWFTFYAFDWVVEQSARQPFTIRHAYSLFSVIRVLLQKIAPNLTFHPNYSSHFLFDENNPITGYSQTLFIVPKSNIVTAGYDQPAQKAPITLGQVFNMLRDCFRCYWYVENDMLKIEHISWFMNGGAYPGTPDFPVVGIDLTAQQVPRNGKAWAFARNQYKFDKPNMAARYQFGWMDDCTQLFEGYPIDIISKFVQPGNIEEINVSHFSSDIDYILLNPNNVSKDGFVLLAAIEQGGQYVLPYVNYLVGTNEHYLQNAYVAFCLLQQYYAYDMPARNYSINGVSKVALGIKKLKTQTISFPALTDPEMPELVKTNIGNGMFQKLSINLSSRNVNATLLYDTE